MIKNPKPRLFPPIPMELEARALLSVVQVADPGATVKPLLTETLEGRFQATPAQRNAPVRVKLTTTGDADPSTRLVGNLVLGKRAVANAPTATGTLTLSGPQGSLKLRITGVSSNRITAGSTLPLNAGVIQGTGAYQNVQAVGRINLAFSGGGRVRATLDLQSPVR